jgi:hypothetical protein
MTQVNADSRGSNADRDFRNHLKTTLWSFGVIFLAGIGLGFLIFRTDTFKLQTVEYRFWLFLLGTGIPYWFVAFTTRTLHFSLGRRIIASVVFSVGATFFTLSTLYFILLISALIAGRGT